MKFRPMKNNNRRHRRFSLAQARYRASGYGAVCVELGDFSSAWKFWNQLYKMKKVKS